MHDQNYAYLKSYSKILVVLPIYLYLLSNHNFPTLIYSNHKSAIYPIHTKKLPLSFIKILGDQIIILYQFTYSYIHSKRLKIRLYIHSKRLKIRLSTKR